MHNLLGTYSARSVSNSTASFSQNTTKKQKQCFVSIVLVGFCWSNQIGQTQCRVCCFSRRDDSRDTSSSSSTPSYSTSTVLAQEKKEKPDVKSVQINKYTGRPFSAKFWTILEKRRGLPVWDYYTKFMETVKQNSAVVLVGETGSGKTTQVRVIGVRM